jgi:hypothetical protein
MRVGSGRYGVATDGERFAVLENSVVSSGPRLSQPVVVMGWK